jgi:hypothetical protein
VLSQLSHAPTLQIQDLKGYSLPKSINIIKGWPAKVKRIRHLDRGVDKGIDKGTVLLSMAGQAGIDKGTVLLSRAGQAGIINFG